MFNIEKWTTVFEQPWGLAAFGIFILLFFWAKAQGAAKAWLSIILILASLAAVVVGIFSPSKEQDQTIQSEAGLAIGNIQGDLVVNLNSSIDPKLLDRMLPELEKKT